jgi:SAM-dependent methyltransferase
MPVAALKASRERFLDRHRDADDWRNRLFSGASLALWRVARPVTLAASRGRVLDAGSGRGSWRRVIVAGGGEYESIDVAPRGDDRPTWIGDVMAMPQVPGDRYDCVVSHQVLEHLPKPWLALAEFFRVLRPGGQVVISAPHLSRRHELPHDYFRFTQQGMGALLADAGFVDVAVQPVGGPLCFLHHQASCILPGVLSPVPVLGATLAAINAVPAWLSVHLDRVIDAGALLPMGVLATARRPPSMTAAAGTG